ncbi:MAG: GOLPH3/VPS74 family protein [Promethearchaeota archaeon]
MSMLAEELILVSIHPETGGEVFYHAWKQVKTGIAGALLMELALEKRIFSRYGKVILLSPKRTGNEILDRILGNIQRSPSQKSIDFWVSEIQDNMGYVMEKLLENFEKQGIIRKEARKHKFGVKMHYPIQKRALRTEILERMRSFRVNERNEIGDYRTYTLLYLMQSCELCQILRNYTRNYNRAQVFDLIDQETRSNKQYVKEMLSCINSFITKRQIISIAV